LNQNFERVNGLIKSFGLALETNPLRSGETFEEYFARILKKIHARK